MVNFQQIDISVNGVDYPGASGRHIGNPTWRESIIVISRDDGEISHLEAIPLDSMVNVQDIGESRAFAGEY